ncbi:Zinc finger, RING/FYVE/PHD-type [Trema orientale]|uniref:Zinc finger, RING/FYVE/PHD-type n=1 Tax=Trema orientale TaxID=63057 RepID=A0A2P5EG14_TREOI|nr:Zinc finger, RING/FYVE/PHD-type [Trema orientale]
MPEETWSAFTPQIQCNMCETFHAERMNFLTVAKAQHSKKFRCPVCPVCSTKTAQTGHHEQSSSQFS